MKSAQRPGRHLLSADWVEHVQDHWDANGATFTPEQRQLIRAAVSALDVELVAADELMADLQRPDVKLLLWRFLNGDDEAGWELVLRLSER